MVQSIRTPRLSSGAGVSAFREVVVSVGGLESLLSHTLTIHTAAAALLT
jgi:hypothetical protein